MLTATPHLAPLRRFGALPRSQLTEAERGHAIILQRRARKPRELLSVVQHPEKLVLEKSAPIPSWGTQASEPQPGFNLILLLLSGSGASIFSEKMSSATKRREDFSILNCHLFNKEVENRAAEMRCSFYLGWQAFQLHCGGQERLPSKGNCETIQAVKPS